jgi:hypothetical protein
MFLKAFSFNQPIFVWNTAACTNMAEMLKEARAFQCDISEWDTKAVTSFRDMFKECQIDFV